MSQVKLKTTAVKDFNRQTQLYKRIHQKAQYSEEQI